jgi:autotransporter-associated beta strand protein
LSGTGSFTQSGGGNSVSTELDLGYNPGDRGTYTLSANGLLFTTDEYIGLYGTGAFTQAGGTHWVADSMSLGLNPGSNGTYRLSGGLLTVLNGETIGGSGSGCFTQSGGTHATSGSLVLAQDSASAGTYNLNGGLLDLSGLAQGGGAAAFNFAGGTLQAGADFSTSVPIVLSTAGGAPAQWVDSVFDTNGNTLTLASDLSGPGGLEKVGAGLLILSGDDSYSGGTIVTGGTLELLDGSALREGSSLAVGADALMIFGGASPGDAQAVPEPSTWALVAAAIWSAGRAPRLRGRYCFRGLSLRIAKSRG